MRIQVVAHTSFLGHTGYNNHSRNFFTHLNKSIPVRVRNYSYVDNLSYLKQEELKLLIEQEWSDPPYKIGTPFKPNSNDLVVNIVLNESHHFFFYDKYQSPMIAYNVWESTKQLPEYFNRILEYDQFWCPTEWQRQCTIEQGYPEDRVKVVPEGVNGQVFCPLSKNEASQVRQQLYKKYNIPREKFSFMIFGRWDYRKSITEMIRAFNEEFKDNDDVVLILSVDNPFSTDGLNSTEERLEYHGLTSDKLRILHFPPRDEYIQWLRSGNVFLSCSRSEGWNLPLIEAIACGTPSICSGWGAQMEFAEGIAHTVNVPEFKPPEQVFMLGDNHDLGVWGEPDFDHLKQVMRKVYCNYVDVKSHAVKSSEEIRKKYTWDNAAKIADYHIRTLVKNHKQTHVQEQQFSFETNFELINGSSKVTFNSSINFNEKILVYLKDSEDNIKHEAHFEDLKVGVNYWISCNTQVDELTFEVFNINHQCIYTETKKFDNIKKEKENISVYSNMELYQDQYINGSVVVKGKRDCSSRYEAIRPIFENYNRPFTILDIGANFGYYSIRAATEYDAISVMIENKDDEIKTLLTLCEQNNCRNKLIVLQASIDLHKLKELSKCEHFDVVLALNVIHHFDNKDVMEVCKVFTELGDNLILETPPSDDTGACGQKNLEEIIDYFKDKDKEKLGEFQRHTSDTKSDLFWIKTPKNELRWPYYEYEKLFDNKNLDVERLKDRGLNTVESDFNSKKISSTRREEVRDWIAGINLKTFTELNGVYPNIYDIIEKLKIRDIQGDYKWDNSNNDLVIHNFILNGNSLHIIDFDDKLIERDIFDDKLQMDIVIHELIKSKKTIPDIVDESQEKRIKINLGCGNDIKPGYVNIDRYNNTGNVDIKADLGDLPFANDSVGELYTSHVFEHIGLNEIYSVVEEWKRVLIPNGKLVLHLPNLETEVKTWLNAPDDKKWFEVSRIFGSQSHAGNSHLCGFNPGSLSSFLKSFDFEIEHVGLGNSGFREEIQCTARKKLTSVVHQTNYICHFVDGPFVNVQGDVGDKSYYQVDFLDPDSESSVHQHLLKINTWTRPYRTFYTNWLVQIRKNGKLEYEHVFDCAGKNVLISMDTKSLGDTLSWFPYVNEFRKKHKCSVWVSTFWNNLFEGHEEYKNIKFITPGTVVNNLYASYVVGCHDNNLAKNKFNWKTVPLQKVASDMLGLEYKEIIPKIAIQPGPRSIKEKYITISEHSTVGSKYWNYEGGWQKVVDYLNNCGYKVVVISREETKLKNIINRINRPIEHTIANIYHSELFIGVSTGPSWLAWALKVPVVLISGYSSKTAEFSTGVERVINENVCHGCFNDAGVDFDRGDWEWCPRLKGTPRQFECTKQITPNMVINAINNILERK